MFCFTKQITLKENYLHRWKGDVYWMELDEMQGKELAQGMDKMLKVFLDEAISEYYFYKENDKWFDTLK